MEEATNEPVPLQRGLLDLSVDLSVPEVYSGSDFTVYLHVTNPFETPIWVSNVDLSLPTRLKWLRPSDDEADEATTPVNKDRLARIEQLRKRIRKLRAQQARIQNNEESSAQRSNLQSEIFGLENELEQVSESFYGSGKTRIDVGRDSDVLYHGAAKAFDIVARDNSRVNIVGVSRASEHVPLIGSLPHGIAVEPGCTAVWTIRLSTDKNPFFIPAKYSLKFNVMFQTQPLAKDQDPDLLSGRTQSGLPRRYSNTTAFTVAIKAALWKVMSGGAVGGFVGSVARTLQDASTGGEIVSIQNLTSFLLAVILSGTAIVFAARKSDTQSFVTVEDFWGGLLVGFIIGYSGTAAFTEMTGVPSPGGK